MTTETPDSGTSWEEHRVGGSASGRGSWVLGWHRDPAGHGNLDELVRENDEVWIEHRTVTVTVGPVRREQLRPAPTDPSA